MHTWGGHFCIRWEKGTPYPLPSPRFPSIVLPGKYLCHLLCYSVFWVARNNRLYFTHLVLWHSQVCFERDLAIQG